MNKSFLKWSGGKSRILDQILPHFPSNCETFIEPFCGTCVVGLNYAADNYVMNDVNNDLNITLRVAKAAPDKLIEELEHLYEQGRERYYQFRDEFNAKSCTALRRAALFIYLNKHGFNGMCRYNKSGGFNVPVGKSKTIHFPRDEIINFSKRMNKAGFWSRDFREVFKIADKGMVLYCDPPYVPASLTLSEIDYTGDGFSLQDQRDLAAEARKAADKGATVLVSNHDTVYTRRLYEQADEIVEIEAWRSISSTNSTRGRVGEILAIYRPKVDA